MCCAPSPTGLYGGGGEHRLLQELLLGIGGVRAIKLYTELERCAASRGVPRQRGPRGLPSGSSASPT